MSKIGMIGAGSWGMALARMLANTGHEVSVWTFHTEKLDLYRKTHLYPALDMRLPESLIFEKDPARLCAGKDLLVTAVPSVNIRATMHRMAPLIPDGQIIVNVAKGMECETLMTLTEVIEDEMKQCGKHARTVALSGPTHAEEVARDLPSTIVSASLDAEAAAAVQEIFMNPALRVYTNGDLKGVELCGAMKNVIAIASGISMGLGFGDNTKAALITRGLAEITRLGLRLGCRRETFAGLAGMGDLIVTATSSHSRNNRCGYLIGQGLSAQEAKEKIGMVVEGINALPAILKLAARYDTELPICSAVDAIIYRGADTKETVSALMMRGKKNESF